MKKKGIFPLCIGLALLAVFLLAAIAPGVLTPYGPKELFARWLPSGGAHLLGTNAMGYDIFTELVYGARQTLLAGILSSILALALGALIGILSTFRGWLGGAFNALIQIFILLPKLIALIVLAAFFGSSTAHLVVLIAAFSWAGTARAVRARSCSCARRPSSWPAAFRATAARISRCGTSCRIFLTCCFRAFCSASTAAS